MPDLGTLVICVIISIASFLIGVYVTRWIFGIDKIIDNLNMQTGLMEEQQKIQTAQLQLLAGMADKLGMPVNDINEVVSEFGIEYE